MPVAKGNIPWNAGSSAGWTDKRGYQWIYVTENGKRRSRRKHRFLMENHLGRRLEPWEIVHHKDGNPSNNELGNLEIKEFGAHTTEHHNGSRHSYDSKRTMEAFGLMREELKSLRSLNADMLAALKRLAEECLASDFNEHWESYKQAEAAIARAEGSKT